MPRGRISQVLKLSKIPEGLKLFVTDVRFTIPEGNNQWSPSFGTQDCNFYPSMDVRHPALTLGEHIVNKLLPG